MAALENFKNAWTLIPGVLITFGALFFLVSHTLFWLAGESTTGTVIGYGLMSEDDASNSVDPSKAAIVKFTDRHNQEYTFKSKVGSGSRFYKDGEKISVIYNPDNPSSAKIREFKTLYLGPLLLLIMGLVFSFIGLILMPGGKAKRPKFIKNK